MALASTHSVFTGRNAFSASRAVRVPVRHQRAIRVRAQYDDAYIPEYPNPQFIKETLEAFPEKGIANVEEARALFSNGGYKYLDVRTDLEYDEVGKVRGSINVPFMNARKVYNADTRKKEVVKSDNPDFVAQVMKKIPNKESKVIVGCSDGKTYTMNALIALDEAGYYNLVGLKGGYNAWFRTWDNKLNRRRYGEYAEDYMGDGSDSCGIHASGAGFDRVDAIERYVPPSY